MINFDIRDKVAVIELDHEVTNAISPEMVNRLTNALMEIKNNPDARSMVIASSNAKFFSIGLDVPRLFGMSQDEFLPFFRSFAGFCLELYILPLPTVAAIGGHAIAGGCILAMCCDQRFIAEGRKLIGLNEIKLGVPIPYLVDRALKQVVGTRTARVIIEEGELHPAAQALEMGLVDKVLPEDEVLPAALEAARTLGAMPQAAFMRVKRNRVEEVAAQVLERLEEEAQYFTECWYSEEARALIKEAMEAF